MTPFRWTLAALVLTLTTSAAGAQSLCDTPQCECDDTQSQVRCSCRRVPRESQDLVLRAEGQGHVPRVATDVWVTDCDRVEVTAMALDGARSLSTVTVASVGRLELADSAFGWWSESGGGGGQPAPHHHHHQHHAGLTVTVTNVTAVPEVPSYAFRGRLRSVTFDRVRIDAIRPFAFGSLTGTTGRIEFRDTVFGQVDQQAFKKFTVNEFVMKGCRFEGAAPSRMLTEITVHDELRLDDVTFGVVRSYAFRVHGPRVFRVRNSRAQCVQSDAFDVKCRGPAFVEDNAFGRLERGAFAAVAVDARKVADAEYQEFVFENNTVTEFEDDALVFDTNGFRPRVDRLIVGRSCGCPARWRTDLVAFSTDYPRRAERPGPPVERAAWCAWPADDGTGDFGRLVKAAAYAAAAVAALVAVVGLAAALVYWLRRRGERKRGHRWTNVPTSSSSSTPPLKGGGRHVVVMPEGGKTYRETELHVIVERAGTTDNRYCTTADSYYHRQKMTEPLTSDL